MHVKNKQNGDESATAAAAAMEISEVEEHEVSELNETITAGSFVDNQFEVSMDDERINKSRKRMKQRSPVWDHFQRQSANSAICNHCQANIISSGNTSNFISHLRSMHSIVFEHVKSNGASAPLKSSNASYVLVECAYDQNSGTNSSMEVAMVEHSIEESPPNTSAHQRKSRSAVWKYYTKQSRMQAVCNQCGSIINSCGNTTNLINHLKTAHKIIIAKGAVVVPESPVNSKIPRRSSQVYASPQRLAIMPPLLKKPESFQQCLESPQSAHKDGQLLSSMLYMLAKDSLSVSFIEGEGFKQFMKLVAPRYKVPCPTTVNSMLDLKFEELVNKKSVLMANAEHISLTISTWAELRGANSYIGVTSHFMAEDTVTMQSLGVAPINGIVNAENIALALDDVLEPWNISKDQVVVCVTNCNSFTVQAVKNCFGEQKQLSCFIHTLDLLAQEVINFLPSIQVLKEKLRNIGNYFNQPIAAEELKKEQKALNPQQAKFLKLRVDLTLSNKWTSCYEMIEHYLPLHEAINLTILRFENPPATFTEDEFEELKEIIMFLKPISDIIAEITEEKHTPISKLIPISRLIKVKFDSVVPKSAAIKEMQTKLLEYVEDAFSDMELNENLAIATVLDPRFKRVHFNQPVAVARALGKIDSLIKSDRVRSFLSDCSFLGEEDEDDIWKIHDNLISNESANQDGEQVSTGAVSITLKQYLQLPVLPRKEDPMKFWAQYKGILPQLTTIAHKYLSCVATVEPAEQLVNKARQIVTEKRKVMDCNRVNKLVFLSSIPYEEW